MYEIELRFHIEPAELPRLAPQLRRGRPLALAARYYDTESRELARAGLGLRLRREGDRWVQTCKGQSDDGITRLEHNAELGAGDALEPDIARHAGHPLGLQLARLLEGRELRPVFQTEILRHAQARRLAGARIEFAWDEGRLLAGEAELPVHELEIELLAGDPQALLAHAHALVARLPLSLDLRSKAERGERLARGQRASPPRKAAPVGLQLGQTPAQALRALLLNAFEPIAGNASQIAAGPSEPAHLRQLHVGLCRLHSGLRLFRGLLPDAALAPHLELLARQAAEGGRALGRLHDEAVLAGPLAAALAAARREAGLPVPVTTASDASRAAAACVRQPAFQQFLIECLGWLDWLGRPSRVAAGDPVALRRALRRRLRRWQHGVQRDAARFAELEAAQRHALRKRIKRLRDAVELCAGLFDAGRMAAGLRALQGAQRGLDALLDVELALARPQEAFDAGWLLARRDALRTQALPLLAALAEAPPLARGRPATGH